VEVRGLRNLYSVIDTRDTTTSETVGVRMRPLLPTDFAKFLSPPMLDGTPSQPQASWKINPWMEVNYAFVTAGEQKAVVAEGRRSLLYKQVRQLQFPSVVGTTSLPLELFNLVTKLTVVAQRNDAVARNNGFDNYTDWEDPYVRPVRPLEGFIDWQGYTSASDSFTSGYVARPRDIIQTMGIMTRGEARLQDKPQEYFQYVVPYRSGRSCPLPGVLAYSFEVAPHDAFQPSGSLNASMFNTLHLKLQMLTPTLPTDDAAPPPLADGTSADGITPPPDPACNAGPRPTLGLASTVPLVVNHPNNQFSYTYDVRVYAESYNVMVIEAGTAGPAFAT
jgi:hypothetical protein